MEKGKYARKGSGDYDKQLETEAQIRAKMVRLFEEDPAIGRSGAEVMRNLNLSTHIFQKTINSLIRDGQVRVIGLKYFLTSLNENRP